MAKEIWRFFYCCIPGSTPGSKYRNLLSYVILGLTCVLFVELLLGGLGYIGLGEVTQLAWVFCWVAFGYFAMTTLGVIRLITNDFQLSPRRLGRDIAISASFTIVAFALYFKSAGIVDTLTAAPHSGGPSDFLYFSTVTFSTLGYGDFRPAEGARLMASFQAVLGNLHLGLVVGAVYLAIEMLSRPKQRDGYRVTSKPRTKRLRRRHHK